MTLFRRKTDDDLFRDSTMTFGQHLGELRVCLFRAVMGLAIGTIIGLAIGRLVVAVIRAPLEEALTRYYEHQALKFAKEKVEELTNAGYEFADDPEKLEQFIFNSGFVLDEVWVSPQQLAQGLGQERAGQITVPTATDGATGLSRLFLWRKAADDPRTRIKTLNAQEGFMIWIKASLVVGLIISSPWVFYQIWTFVAAGLYRHERRYVHIFLPFSLVLFLSGVVLAYFVFQPVLNFLFGINAWVGIDPDPRISEWMGFVLFMPLGFGISFQLPLVMLFLERIGVFTIEAYLSYWRVAILVIFVAAMLLTPTTDPYSLTLLAGPLTVLYFFGVLLCRVMPRLRPRAADYMG